MNGPTLETESDPSFHFLVIFIHGWLEDANVWLPVIGGLKQAFSSQDLQAIAYEMEGFGTRISYLRYHTLHDIKPRAQAERLHIKLAELDTRPRQLVIVAHGVGGVVAKEFIETFGDSYTIKSVILCSASIAHRLSFWNVLIGIGTSPFIGEVLARLPNCLASAIVKYLMTSGESSAESRARCTDLYQRVVRASEIVEYGIAFALMKQLRAFAWNFDCPMVEGFISKLRRQHAFELVIVWGCNDFIVPLKVAEDLIYRIRQSVLRQHAEEDFRVELVCVEGGGHFLPSSHHEKLTEIIRQCIVRNQKGEALKGIGEIFEVV